MVCAPALAADSIGEVDAVTGDCRIIRDGDSLAARLRQAVMLNDEIATGEGARISILFKDETILTLDESSQASLDDYVYDEDAANLLFKFTKGTFRAITGEIVERNPEGFNIETPVVTIGIRGSDIYAIVQPEGEETGALHLGEGHALEVMSATYAVRITQGGLRVKVSPDGTISEPMRIPDDMFDRMLRLGSSTPSGTSALEEPQSEPVRRTIRPPSGTKTRAETLQNLGGTMGGSSSGGTMPSPGSVNGFRGTPGNTGTGGTTTGNPMMTPGGLDSLRGVTGTTGAPTTRSPAATTTPSPAAGTTTTRSPATGTTATGGTVTGSPDTSGTLSNPNSLNSRGTTTGSTTTDSSGTGSTTTRSTSTTTTAPTLKKSTAKPVLKAKPTPTIR